MLLMRLSTGHFCQRCPRRIHRKPHGVSIKAVPTQSLDWSAIKTGAQFKTTLRKAEELGIINAQYRSVFGAFHDDYLKTVIENRVPSHDEEFATRIVVQLADRLTYLVQNPYTFPSYHKRVLEPFNYYEFGQSLVEPLIDFENSFIGNLDIWQRISDQVSNGENVVLLANHQTEADPPILSHLLRTNFPRLAEDVIHVAGDRVVSDPLCVPVSLGRNLFCVYSKRHINDVPKEKEMKLKMNRKTIMTMARQMNLGGLLLWVAPSGGRDRPNEQGLWVPNEFDPGSVGVMQTLLDRAKKDGHLYVMAMVSWKVMPPPSKVESKLGESRVTNFAGVGVSVAPELDIDEILRDLPPDSDSYLSQAKLASHARDICEKEFLNLLTVIENPEVRSAFPQFEQPWLRQPVG